MKLGTTSVIAHCADCEWRHESQRALKHAKEHNERTGHEVHAEEAVAHRWPRHKTITR